MQAELGTGKIGHLERVGQRPEGLLGSWARWALLGCISHPRVWEKQQVLVESSPPPCFSELVGIVMHLYSA